MDKVDPSLLRYEQGPRALLDEVLAQIQRMREMVAHHADILTMVRPAVSGWSIRDHFEHLVITSRSAVIMLEKSLLSDLRHPGRNADGDRLFEWLYLPRGQTQAPEFALPKGMDLKKLSSSLKRLQVQVGDLSQRLEPLLTAPGRAFHPYLGNLKASEWLAFICIHQNHHFNIARELRALFISA